MSHRSKASKRWIALWAMLAALPLACAPSGATVDESSEDPSDGADASSDSSSGGGGGRDASIVDDPDGGPAACEPKTCEDLEAECGYIADGCGKVVSCGDCQEEGESCGGHGIANKCGGACEPFSCEQIGADCGIQGDGCGKTMDCGGCTEEDEFCGGGGPNLCGKGEPSDNCKTKDEACGELGAACGEVGDGCGGVLDCGDCTGGESCGGGGVPFQCGKPYECIPKSCDELGYDCGYATDGCNDVIDCGPIDCGPGEVCGGGGDNRCGHDPSDPCAGGTTSVSGTVYMPNGTVPLYGALVYVPKSLADIPAIADKVACERCDTQVPPTAVAHALSATDGSFTLKGVPSGNVPLVIQVGRFRRKVDIQVNACQNNVLSASQTRLARRHEEANEYDHIPKVAMVTGMVDALECVLRRVGIADDQFSKPAGNGRIHMVRADGFGGAKGPRLTPNDTSDPRASALLGNANTLSAYDMVLLACEASAVNQNSGHVQRLIDYANAGGRIFTTHYSYTWLNKLDPFKSTASWTGEKPLWSTGVGTVDTSFTKGLAFAEWLGHVGADINPDPAITQLNIIEPRGSVSAVSSNARQWIWHPRNGKNYVQHMTFNAPVGQPVEQQCGRVVFSDFHVTGGDSLSSKTFPEQCAGRTDLNAQEKALAFMLFDLSSCIQSDGSSQPCTPKTCADQGLSCGKTGDGCGNILECGDCEVGLTCGGGGVPGQCGKQQCSKLSCHALGIECGPAGDGCGAKLECGSCPPGEICGGGGPGKCGPLSCTPQSCAAQGIECGPAGDGCGGLLDCGQCQNGQSCGGGGIPGQCGGGQCEPKTCAALGFDCGPAADGCGKLLDCGSCPSPMSCGGDGRPGKCGGIR